MLEAQDPPTCTTYIYYGTDSATKTKDLPGGILCAGRHTLTAVPVKTANYDYAPQHFSVNVRPRVLTVNGTPTVASRTYDGTCLPGSISLPELDKSNVWQDDTVSLRYEVDASAVKPAAGSYILRLTPRLTNPNYTLDDLSTLFITFSITEAKTPTLSLTGDELHSVDKTYDGTTELLLPEGGVALPDNNAHITGAYYDSRNVGKRGITVVVKPDDNYLLDDGTKERAVTYPKTGTIFKRDLTINPDAAVEPKTYDGTTGIELKTITLPTLNGVIAGDDVLLNPVYAKTDKPDPGYRTATISFASLMGDDAANYALKTLETTAPVIIKPRIKKEVRIVLRGDTALTYGQSTIGASHPADILLETEPLISGTHIIAGHEGGVTLPAGVNVLRLTFVPQDTLTYATADTVVTIRVARRELSTYGSFAAMGKIYDGTTSVNTSTLTLPAIIGSVEGDDLSLTVAEAHFATKNVGGNSVAAQLSLSGDDAANYTISANLLQVEANASITPLAVTLIDTFASSGKVYDGTAEIDFDKLTLPETVGHIEGDDISLKIKTASFASASVGSNSVHATLTLSGKDAANYTIDERLLNVEAQAEISPRPLTFSGSFAAKDKVYDRTTDVNTDSISLPKIEGVINGEDVRLKIESLFFATKEAGQNTVIATLSLSGDDAANYSVDEAMLSVEAEAAILPKPLTYNPLIAKFEPRYYDGTDIVADSQIVCLPPLVGIILGDEVSPVWTAEYESAEVGPNNIILSCSLAGKDSGNYSRPDDTAISCEILERKTAPTPDPEPTPEPIVATLITSNVSTLCTTGEATIIAVVESGHPSRYNISFDDAARKAGYANIVAATMPEREGDEYRIHVPSPTGDAYGTIGGTLTLCQADGACSAAIPFSISIRPSAQIVGVKFGNTLFVDNSSNRFTAYQWYADGKPIVGATRQFYHSSPLPEGDYTVRLTLADGDTAATCPFAVTSLPDTDANSLRLSPSPATFGASVRVAAPEIADGEELTVEFFSAAGSLCEKATVRNGETIAVTLRQGVYAVRCTSEGVRAGQTTFAVK